VEVDGHVWERRLLDFRQARNVIDVRVRLQEKFNLEPEVLGGF